LDRNGIDGGMVGWMGNGRIGWTVSQTLIETRV